MQKVKVPEKGKIRTPEEIEAWARHEENEIDEEFIRLYRRENSFFTKIFRSFHTFISRVLFGER